MTALHDSYIIFLTSILVVCIFSSIHRDLGCSFSNWLIPHMRNSASSPYFGGMQSKQMVDFLLEYSHLREPSNKCIQFAAIKALRWKYLSEPCLLRGVSMLLRVSNRSNLICIHWISL